ncbi:MAG: calcium/sodium antiporter [ANME-2 cluster archaeon]|jgi:cation:H+ antiporter|nr:MAG: calcium/sodium antiporter [ANME-2 cluster archaeon]
MNVLTENLIIQSGILIISLVGLIFFADKLLIASTRLARALGISDAVIGLTLLAYGTSLPEFSVSAISTLSNHPELSVSNVLGSNIFNIAFIIGLAAFIRPFTVAEANLIGRDNYIMIITALLLTFLLFFFDGINRITGVFMVLILVIYTYYIFDQERHSGTQKKDESISRLKEVSIVLLCFIFVIVSGKLAVDSGIQVARALGVSEWLIGATIIAVGTSLPELVVSVTAAKKGLFGIAIGNIVGSNIFNIMWILGFSASVNPILLDFDLIKWDLVFFLGVTGIMAYHLKKAKFSRIAGQLFVMIYMGYMAYLLIGSM